MKLRSVEFNEDEDPKSLTVEMTVNEAAMIYAFAGNISPADVYEATNSQRWVDANEEIASCLAGSFFNRFWEAGHSEVGPRRNIVKYLKGDS